MHPQLTLDNNQMCVDQILAFQRCHEEVGLWGKLTARCNTEKSLLDRRARPCRKHSRPRALADAPGPPCYRCFREQKKVKRKRNREDRPTSAGTGAPGRGAWHQALKDGIMLEETS